MGEAIYIYVTYLWNKKMLSVTEGMSDFRKESSYILEKLEGPKNTTWLIKGTWANQNLDPAELGS